MGKKQPKVNGKKSKGRAKVEQPEKRRPRAKRTRGRLLVGVAWPKGISVRVSNAAIASRARKDKTAVVLVYAFVVLFLTLAGWAMSNHDREILRQIVTVDKAGLFYAGGWLGGAAILRVLARMGSIQTYGDSGE